MKISIISLFPEMVQQAGSTSIIKRAREKGILCLRIINIRDFTNDPHRTADDTPYGGGPGMVLKIEPVVDAIESVVETDEETRLVLTSARGRLFKQGVAEKWAKLDHLVIVAGHYEGIDERIRIIKDITPVSIGDYVNTGGELAACVMMDTVIRLLPGVLGNPESLDDESFNRDGLLDYPHYTKPPVFRGASVPGVLLSGDHDKIKKWREEKSFETTKRHRPDLLKE